MNSWAESYSAGGRSQDMVEPASQTGPSATDDARLPGSMAAVYT